MRHHTTKIKAIVDYFANSALHHRNMDRQATARRQNQRDFNFQRKAVVNRVITSDDVGKTVGELSIEVETDF